MIAGTPLFVSSGDLIADRRYKWAMEMLALGDPLAAAEVLEQTVELAPGFATAWFALGALRDRLGDRDGAIAAFGKARDNDPEDYHGARLQLARLGAGEATPAMTETYVRRLFDQHAPEFDVSLRERLAYRGPELLLETVQRVCALTGRPPRFVRMLDLGCGTGLAGAVFRPHVERLVGVDISSGMIAQARAKGVYDRLAVTGILAALGPASERYDLVLAADVLVYVSDLVPVAAAVARNLEPGGLFAFTVETHADDDVVLQPTLRYAHAASYVRAAIGAAGLVVHEMSDGSTRTEKGVPVPGLIAVAGISTAP